MVNAIASFLQKMKTDFRLILGLLTFCFFSSCVKDKPNPVNGTPPSLQHRGMLVVNEGSFGNNNGELSFLDFQTNLFYNNLFYQFNQHSLGDVVQSICKKDSELFVLVNNSNKIEVLDAKTFKSKATINTILSPRYMTMVDTNKAYVSCMYHPYIYVINTTTHQLVKTITVDVANTEKMLYNNGYCYVTNWDTSSSWLYEINTNNDQIEKKINLGCRASHDIVQDKNGWLWILSGNKYKNTGSVLTNYDPATQQIIHQYHFDSAQDPFRLITNAGKDTLYYINVNYDGSSVNNGLYRMAISDTLLPQQAFIQASGGSYFWGIGLDTLTQHLFIADPKGFTQQSTIYEYDKSAQFIQLYKAGIGSNGFLFW